MSKRTRAPRKLQGFAMDEEMDELGGLQSPAAAAAGLTAAAATAAVAAHLPSGAPSHAYAAEDSAQDYEDEPDSTDEEEDSPPARKKAKKQPAKKPRGKAAAAKQAKVKKGPRIGAKKAKKVYSLDDSDLAQMKDVKSSYSFFGFSRMYSPAELEEYARKTHAGSEWFERSLSSRLGSEESRRQRKRDCRAVETARAVDALTKYGERSDALAVEQYGTTKLPDPVLLQIMVCLAKTREPGGLRGFAEVAQDLANASLANWDLHRATKAGFDVLAKDAISNPPVARGPPYDDASFFFSFLYGGNLEALPGPSSLGGWEFWEGFVHDPVSPTAAKLKDAMRMVRLSPKGTKAEMALRVLEVFGLKAASSVPVQLLRAVRLERGRRQTWDGPEAAALHTRVNTAIDQLVLADKATWGHLESAKTRGVSRLRAAIRARFSSIDEFVEAASAADKERRRKEAEAGPAAAPPAAAAAAGAGPARGLAGLGARFQHPPAASMPPMLWSLMLAAGGDEEGWYDDDDSEGF